MAVWSYTEKKDDNLLGERSVGYSSAQFLDIRCHCDCLFLIVD